MGYIGVILQILSRCVLVIANINLYGMYEARVWRRDKYSTAQWFHHVTGFCFLVNPFL